MSYIYDESEYEKTENELKRRGYEVDRSGYIHEPGYDEDRVSIYGNYYIDGDGTIQAEM